MQADLPARAIVKSMNLRTKATARCLIRRESGSAATSKKPIRMKSPNSTCSAQGSRASPFPSPEIWADFPTREGRCSLKLPGWLRPGSLRTCCLKTYPTCFLMTAAGRLRPSSMRWMDWGMVWNGKCLTAKISASPNPAKDCTLSDILMRDAGEKYFLSPKQQERLLCKSAADLRENASTPPKE